MKSQLDLTDGLINIANSVSGEGLDLIINLKNKVYSLLEFRPYVDENKEDERQIRWKRTADKIFSDGYVYQGKACTDIVIAYLGLAKAKAFETRFVKLFKEGKVHSVAEILVCGEWYIYDVAVSNSMPKKGAFVKDISRGGWSLWKKGRDSWDLELKKFEDIRKIN